MSKHLSAKYCQENKERLQKKARERLSEPLMSMSNGMSNSSDCFTLLIC